MSLFQLLPPPIPIFFWKFTFSEMKYVKRVDSNVTYDKLVQLNYYHTVLRYVMPAVWPLILFLLYFAILEVGVRTAWTMQKKECLMKLRIAVDTLISMIIEYSLARWVEQGKWHIWYWRRPSAKLKVIHSSYAVV